MSSPINVEVVLRPHEAYEQLIKRFMRKVKKDKIIEIYREHTYYKKPSIKRKEKEEARQRVIKKMQAQQNTDED